MSSTQQYALDLYRFSQQAQARDPGAVSVPPPGAPPQPGSHEARLLRAWLAGLRFRRRLSSGSGSPPVPSSGGSAEAGARPNRPRRSGG